MMEFQLSYFKSWKMMLWKCCTQYASKFGNSAVATRLEKVSFYSNRKETQGQRTLKLCKIALISHTSKVILKILQARFQQYMNHEIPDVQAGFRKGKRNQISNCQHPLNNWKRKRIPETHLLLLIDYAKAFDCVDHNKLWEILKEMGIPNHLTCLLRNLYAGQEATVRTGHGTTDWFHIGKGVRPGCILSPCLFNLYTEYIMRNAGLEETQAVIKMPGEISTASDMQMTPPLWQKVKKN